MCVIRLAVHSLACLQVVVHSCRRELWENNLGWGGVVVSVSQLVMLVFEV